MKKLIVLAASVVLVAAANAQIAAFNNAEIRPLGGSSTDNDSGIRVFNGNTSTLFFNTQGSGAGSSFSTFGVADFDLSSVQDGSATGVTGATITLEEDPAFFGNAGLLEIYIATDTSPNLIDATANPANTPAYQLGNNSQAAIDPAFGATYLLGSGNFTPVGAGSQTIIPLTFNGAANALLTSAIQSGGNIRLIVAPGDANVAFTGAGQGNFDGAAPTIDFTVVPEPASLMLIALAALAIRRR